MTRLFFVAVCSFYRVNRAEILLMAICALRSCEIIHSILFSARYLRLAHASLAAADKAIAISLYRYLPASLAVVCVKLYYKIVIYTKVESVYL